jgi:hypothetical protein
LFAYVKRHYLERMCKTVFGIFTILELAYSHPWATHWKELIAEKEPIPDPANHG